MQFLLISMILMNSILFLMMNHPLTMGFNLMIQTILISLFSGNFCYLFWFSYSLFLIFMGGMLILFMYMTSLASNEMFNFNLNYKNFLFSIILLIFILSFIFDFKNIMLNNKTLNNDTISFYSWQNLMEKNILLLNKLYNFPMNLITILLVSYLFLTLIMSVKITNIYKGPIRTKMI